MHYNLRRIFLSGNLQFYQVKLTNLVAIPFLSIFAFVVWEEVVFRGVLLNLFRKIMDLRVALLFSSVLFGMIHIFYSEEHTFFGAISIGLVGGILLGVSYLYAKNIWLPIGIHYSVNILIYSISWYDVSNIESKFLSAVILGDRILTGLNNGLASSPVTIVLAAILVLAIWKNRSSNF